MSFVHVEGELEWGNNEIAGIQPSLATYEIDWTQHTVIRYKLDSIVALMSSFILSTLFINQCFHYDYMELELVLKSISQQAYTAAHNLSPNIQDSLVTAYSYIVSL